MRVLGGGKMRSTITEVFMREGGENEKIQIPPTLVPSTLPDPT